MVCRCFERLTCCDRDHQYLQPLSRASITGSALTLIVQPQILRRSRNPDPSHSQVTVGFELLGESSALADLTGGRAQVETPTMGNGRKYRQSPINLPTLTSCVAGG